MYVKLFGSILDSSIWAEDHATVRVWITMLTMANEDGMVEASPSGLARRANVTREECRKALEIFQKPDIESKSQEWGGRRIELVDGGWLLLNYAKYREMRTKKQVIDASRQARQRKRERDGSRSSRDIHVEAEAYAEAEAKKKHMTQIETDFDDFWSAYPKRAGGNPRGKALTAYTSRRKECVSAEALLVGVKAYAAYHEHEGSVGTQYVKQAQFWLAPSYRGWEQDWSVPDEPMSSLSIDPSTVEM